MSKRLGLGMALVALLGMAPALPASAAPEGAPQPAAQPRLEPPPNASPTLADLARDLVLEIVENGPGELWTLHVSNAGASPYGVVADPSVLWFEVALPDKPLPVTCRLPGPLWPKAMRRRALTVLNPGERFSRRFDPRFFCFEDLRQTVLVVGARVTPHFGWPEETKEVRAKGKRTLVTLPPQSPFVAWLLPPTLPEPAPPPGEEAEPTSGDGPTSSGAAIGREANGEPVWQEPSEGLKHITGAAIVLSPAYSVWSEPPARVPERMNLVMRAGSDAEDERSATVTVAVENATNRSQQMVLRRELFEYRVVGPDGSFVCSPTELGPPDHASFATLPPRSVQPMVVRLIEMCPARSLSRPGVYEVNASFVSRWSGQGLNIDAFAGKLETSSPALIRIRSGEQLSFLRAVPMVGSAPGVTAPGANGMMQAPAEIEAPPVEGSPEVPAEDAPPVFEHEAPGELPPVEAPPAGTTVE